MCQELGIETELIPRIATPFGGGIARTGVFVCGSVAGAVMAIGLRHGREEPWQPRDNAYALAQEFCQRFEAEMGHLCCRDLTEVDLVTPEGRAAYYTSDVRQRVCLPGVGVAFRMVMELLERPVPAAADD